MARKLKTSFYCPKWIGDEVFDLDDKGERASELINISKEHVEPELHCGFNKEVFSITDGTNIKGYFQSEKYFDAVQVKKWYTFKEAAIVRVKDKYKEIDFSQCVGMHIRFGDFEYNSRVYIPRIFYYKKALSLVNNKKHIITFSDEIKKAERYFHGIAKDLIYIYGNEPYEDLYLMTQCRDFIGSCSTLSWWGAWLNCYKGHIIVMPKYFFRPGLVNNSNDIQCGGCISLRACLMFIDDYNVVVFRRKIRKSISKLLDHTPGIKRYIKEFISNLNASKNAFDENRSDKDVK